MRDGLLGLILFVFHWLSPETGKASIDAEFIKNEAQHCQFQCEFDIAWNRQLEQLVDAGIPLRFNIMHYTDKYDTTQFTRTLSFDMVKFTYYYLDSALQSRKKSSSYTSVHLALRDFCKWKITIPKNAEICKVEVIILPSMAGQLNRMVDMSRIWGQQKILYQFIPKEKMNKASQRKREKNK